MASIIYYRNGELFNKEYFQYDNIGNLIEKKVIDNTGNITEKLIQRYLNDTLIYQKIVCENSFGESDIEKIYKFDTLGNEVYSMYRTRRKEKFEKEDNFSVEFEKEYINNMLSKSKGYTNGKHVGIATSEYVDGKEAYMSSKEPIDNTFLSSKRISYYPNSTNKHKETIKSKAETIRRSFDKNGKISKLQTIKTNGDSEEYTYEYLYDKIGNWIKIIEYKNTIPIKIRERKILYY